MVESVRVSRIGRIRESTKKPSGRVSENGRICESTETLSRQVPEKVESLSVPENGRIRASAGNRLNP